MLPGVLPPELGAFRIEPGQTRRFLNYSYHQYRLSVLQWNSGPARRNPTRIVAATCGRFHAVLRQEASDHVLQVSDQFIAYTGPHPHCCGKNRDASTDVLRRLHAHMTQHEVDFIGGDFNMSAFSTVGDPRPHGAAQR